MAELDRMIAEVKETRAFHVAQRNRGVKGAGIEGLACAIRERALLDAKRAVLAEIAHSISLNKDAEDEGLS